MATITDYKELLQSRGMWNPVLAAEWEKQVAEGKFSPCVRGTAPLAIMDTTGDTRFLYPHATLNFLKDEHAPVTAAERYAGEVAQLIISGAGGRPVKGIIDGTVQDLSAFNPQAERVVITALTAGG